MILKIENGVIIDGLDEFCSRAEDPYLEMMIMAIAEVSPNYIVYNSSYHVERTYECELYHQWSKLLEASENHSQLCLNGEPSKHIQGDTQQEVWRFPDMILHHSQIDNNDNRIACELKRRIWSEAAFDKDMETLNYLLTGASENAKLKKNFKWGVFVQIGGTIENIKNYVRSQSFNESIWCIVVNESVTQLTICTIGELMSGKKCKVCNAILPDSAKYCSECGCSVMTQK